MKQTKDHLITISLLAAGLLTGCSADDQVESVATSQDEIRLVVKNDWQAATRSASIYENDDQLTSFIVSAYLGGTTDKYFDARQVNKNTDGDWNFANGRKYYWPMSESLDFFAYMPVDLSTSVVSADNLGYTPLTGPSFTTTLPSTGDAQADKTEFIYAYVTGKTKEHDGDAGVSLDFHHPFALLRFSLRANNEDVTINSVTIKDVKTSGTFTHGATPQWSDLGGVADFVATVNQEFLKSDQVQQVGGSYLVIPQSFSQGKQTIVVNYSDGGVSDTMEAEIEYPQWNAGSIYTYKLAIETFLKVTVTAIEINPWQKYNWN